MTGLLEIIAFSWASLAMLTWVFVVFFAPSKPLEDEASPQRRTRRARAWLFAPIWVPTVLLLGSVMPGLLGLLGTVEDHCLSLGPAHHHHLCVVHPPHTADAILAWALPLAVGMVIAGAIVFGAVRAWRSHALGRALVGMSRRSTLGDDVRELDQDEPVAVTIGWFRPIILLSRGLLARISTSSLDVVLAHEREHLRRRDTRWALIERVASSLYPAPATRTLLDELQLAREQACDVAAADRVGSPLAVARALTEVARLNLAVVATGVSVASGSLEARVRFLLDRPRRSASDAPWGIAALATLLIVAGAGPIHHVIEAGLSFLLH